MGGQQRASHVSCFNCEFFENNKCTWFKYYKDEEPKEIVNKGCKQFCDHPLIIKAIRMFR